MNKSNHSNHICDICDKEYTHRQNLWRHKRTHINHNCAFLHPDNSKSPPDNSKSPPDNSKSPPDNSKSNFNNLSCKYCNKKFTRIDNLTRHINSRCSKKQENNLEDTIKKQTDELNQLKLLMFEQSTQLKSIISELINKNCKVHHKTLQKINKQLNGDHNTINENINKGTINNTYNIIGLGHENLTDVFSKKEKLNILKYRFNSLPQLVEYAHFNDKYPQFKNILITNTQNNLAYKYDTKKKQFVAVNKDELLEDIVDERMCDINSFYEELEEELDTKTKEILDKVKDKIENEPAYKLLKKQDIKLIIYNNRKKVSKEVTDNLEIEV
jgi:hypothetical protein